MELLSGSFRLRCTLMRGSFLRIGVSADHKTFMFCTDGIPSEKDRYLEDITLRQAHLSGQALYVQRWRSPYPCVQTPGCC